MRVLLSIALFVSAIVPAAYSAPATITYTACHCVADSSNFEQFTSDCCRGSNWGGSVGPASTYANKECTIPSGEGVSPKLPYFKQCCTDFGDYSGISGVVAVCK